MEKPRSIVIATSLLWANMALGFLRSVLEFFQIHASLAALAVAMVVYGVLALLISNISRGRNWARITFAVLFAVGLPVNIQVMFKLGNDSPVQLILSLVQFSIQAWALVCIFRKPGSTWFSKQPVEIGED
jgi:hypothetical protein